MFSLWLILIVLILILLVVYAMLKLRREKHRSDRRTEAIRQSRMYPAILEMLTLASQHIIAQVRVTGDDITVRFLDPRHEALGYSMQEHGFEPLEERFTLALAQALALDFPFLSDEKQYRLVETRRSSTDGTGRVAYAYELTMERKSQLMRQINRR
ncbi:MAG: hypothetical protein IJ229_00845 [Clostridia bacterium]|nr:hypothetical protein [Clostridia bacterium]MBR1684942.1 hypothetical protein [Clostridia bacterium]MBR2288425.1 hypothetical protein [Clostridia bacterium]